MKQPTRITLINSGDFAYARLDISNHTILSAMNNRGKSTLLRAMLFAETGNPKGLGLKENESFTYYFSRKGIPGYMIFDYVDKDEETNYERRYCLLCMAPNTTSGREYHFIDAEFDEKFLDSGKGTMYNNWGGIKENLERLGISSTVTAKNDAELTRIMNGSSEDKNTLRYAMFTGTRSAGKKVTSAAFALESIFRNGSLDQSSIKNIFIDKVRLRSNGGIPDTFNIKELRGLASSFSTTYKDYLAYRSGSMDESLDAIISSFEKYETAKEKEEWIPSIIKKTLNLYEGKLAEAKVSLDILEETIKIKRKTLQDLEKQITEDAEKRKFDIGYLDRKIKEITKERSKFTDSEWKNQLVWIKEVFEFNGTERLYKLLTDRNNELKAITSEFSETVKWYEGKLEELNKDYNQSIASINQQFSELHTRKQNDELLNEEIRFKKLEELKKEFDEKCKAKTEEISEQINEYERQIQSMKNEQGILNKMNKLSIAELTRTAAERTKTFNNEGLLHYSEEFMVQTQKGTFEFIDKTGYDNSIFLIKNKCEELNILKNQIKEQLKSEYCPPPPKFEQ